MCYHKSRTAPYDKLAEYYSVEYSNMLAEIYSPMYHENGFDFSQSPVVTAGKPQEMQMFHWGLVPFWIKDEPSAMKLRIQTLNCISEEIYEKPSFRDAANNGQRCLIPCTGFMEWKWADEKGKNKIPYYIRLKEQPIFSLAGLYSRWKNNTTGIYYYSYTVLTTVANPLMSEIHNSKKRMPVIISREYEKDWLNKDLTKQDVLAFCQPFDDTRMTAHTISKLITTKGVDTNVSEVLNPHSYENNPVSGTLF
jgi:putative SOS response-associated peptidase YedK